MDDNEQVETELNNENKVVEQPVKTKSVKKNYFYNLLYQIFILVVPLIVTPYISRVLTAEGVGQYSFSHSLITYFTVFASLGFVTYGQREIAAFQKDRHKQSVIFWDIIICRFFSVLIMLGLNLVLFFTKIYGEYSQLMFIFSDCS